jgi:dihydropteroate synthase
MPSTWPLARGRALALDRPIVFGVLNVTPDSFSDGGAYGTVDAAVRRAGAMLGEGTDVIDVGGESTRPQGTSNVDAAEERRRVVPVVEAIVARFPDAVVSVDTVKSDVARAAIDAGAVIVNDVSALRLDPSMAHTVAASRAGVVLMHSRGTVEDMATYAHAQYADVVEEVIAELRERLGVAHAAGIARESIVIDPGVGFAKRAEHSLAMLHAVDRLAALGYPVLVGASRKRFVGAITGVERPAERVYGTVGAHVAALARGARLFRVHDVAAARQSLDVAWAVLQAGQAPGAAA